MNLDSFRMVTTTRVALLTGTVLLFAYFLVHTNLYELDALLALLVSYQVFAFLRWIEKKNENLTRFLEAVEANDFSQTFSVTTRSKAFDGLHNTLNRISTRFEEMKVEGENQFQYFQFVLEHLPVGLIVFQRDGKIEMINRSAKRVLGLSYLKNLKELIPVSNDLYQALSTMDRLSGGFVRIEGNNLSARLAIQKSEFRMKETSYTIASIQDMRGELEEIELEAWQNLIRVLTHEIVNSITPIASLASTANKILSDSRLQSNDNGQLVSPSIKDVHVAVKTIESRSEGLLRFVNSYRTLTHIPSPKLKLFSIITLFSRVEQLVRSSVSENGIQLTSTVKPESLELKADPDLIEQVLLNLLMNSVQALEGRSDGRINLSAQLEEKGKITIRIEDNGPGIPREIEKKIFIPFFTTRDNGSGIGLSLSRQILHLHHALISVSSKTGEQTVFTIVF